MLLKKILKDIKIIDSNFKIDNELEINKIAYHTDKIQKGDVFVAIKGYITDGHKYIGKAIEKGALICVVEEFSNLDIKQIKVENSRIALANLAFNYYNRDRQKIYTIGITATNGKTTTSYMLESIFKAANLNAGLIGTVETKYADITIPSILTTPESLELQEHIANMRESHCEVITMEVSSSAQELYRNKNIDFDIVTFNNLSREHIDQHGSFDNYFNAKSKLIVEATQDSVAILNFDYDLIKELSNKTKAKVLSYSLENKNCDFFISNLDLSTGKGKFTFNIAQNISLKNRIINKGAFNLDLSVAGYSSVLNAVVAIIISLVMGLEVDVITRGLKSFSGVERRFELIYDEEFKIIDDHFANTKNIEVTMSTLEKMQYNNFYFLYAIRGNRGVTLNRENSEEIVNWVKKLNPKVFYATLSQDTVDYKNKVTKEELDVFCDVMEKNNIEYKIFNNLEESINAMMDKVSKDDIFLLAGCQGMDKGAKFALNNIIKLDKTKDPGQLKELIQKRIC